jgi:hypothetical protein
MTAHIEAAGGSMPYHCTGLGQLCKKLPKAEWPSSSVRHAQRWLRTLCCTAQWLPQLNPPGYGLPLVLQGCWACTELRGVHSAAVAVEMHKAAVQTD